MTDQYPDRPWPATTRRSPAPAPRPQRPFHPVMARHRPARHRPLLPLGAILGIMMALVLAGSGVLNQVASAATDLLGSQTGTATVAAQDAGTATDLSVEEVADAASAAVVTVTTFGDATSQTGIPGFGQAPEGTATEQPLGTGSGFVWDADGHVITNAHVVSGGESFQVTFLDGTTVDATLVGSDVYADVAVLRVELEAGQSLPAVATIGTSADVAAGEGVVAIGSPFGELTNTVSQGIVGANGRSLPAAAGVYDLTDLIQHDAPIYSGNSGGPLLDLSGEVIGINVATLQDTQTGQTSGIGFALSIDSVRGVIDQLIADGSVDRPYLGIQSQVTESGAQGVVEVEANGPSDGTLQAGDLITGIGGTAIGFETPFLNELFAYSPGDTVDLTIQRDGEEQTVSVTLGERPVESAA
ncbi:MAG: hypothetical protein AVDCRST_MAG33-370 [uncultured Thermomicrobiales bacterium]|uniref:PDZ domain-containing protein n=1 Tax=uncultured Thermomicrobiales bacterium TaxID=1645740 RepID=A0A6J4UAY2_9BACT|nr:MAG: hypothetical protein AVDCRST_MAG33-370 [uncultured Thermomicrobiales bacterium]